MTTYDVRIWAIGSKETTKGRSYRVRWLVGTQRFSESFQTKALAESFRSRLVVAQREGIAFDETVGLPEPMARELNSKSWYEHAVEFVDMKWARAAPKHRKSIAESLTTVTPAFLSTERGTPPSDVIRKALYNYVFNRTHRAAGEPPAELASAIRWLQDNTVKVSDLSNAATVRKALDTLALRLDGGAAAPATVARKRAVLYGALRYAVELGRLNRHPMDYVQWIAPKSNEEVDRRTVVNPRQAKELLDAVYKRDPHLTAFFGCMYYAALRPAEALFLREEDCELPESGWGWLHLAGSTQHAGSEWTDDQSSREDRGLKHRAKTAVRDVPAAPALVALLRDHITEYGVGPGGRLFTARDYRRGPVSLGTYTRAWRQAREAVFTEAQLRSPLAKVPYHLRHAAVSLWLNAGVPATQVAEWAGHSLHVLLKVYAKCIDGEDETSRRRIEAVLTR